MLYAWRDFLNFAGQTNKRQKKLKGLQTEKTVQEFFVDNYRVDIQRNQIVREGEVIALEPKVLEVLRVLAQNPGEVVSHQMLHDKVWPDIIVAPNALQRCIGQLRKALNDDGKSQRIIVTHPKKGYSLIAPVSIRSPKEGAPLAGKQDTATTAASASATQAKTPSLTTKIIATGCILLLFLVIAFWQSRHPATPPLQQFTQLKPLTATDASEFYSTFSPDGRYVAFSRTEQGMLGHMWLLDRNTGAEIRLTKDAGRYGQPNWSTDGKQLAFLQLDSCIGGCNPTPCTDLNILFVPLALSEPLAVNQTLKCANIPLQGVQWLDEERLLIIRKRENHDEIIILDSKTGLTEKIYQSEDHQLYSLSYGPKTKQLAAMQAQTSQPPELVLLSPETREFSKQTFTGPKRYASNTRWYPVWDANEENLLFSASSRLYLMDQLGNLHSQEIPTFQDISRPMFHPDGKSIAMTLGKVDRDIALLELEPGSVNPSARFNETEDFSKTENFTEKEIARSILRENDAQFQPDGHKIAFFSQRSGTRQLWFSEQKNDYQEHVYQLSHLDELFPEYFVWSANGEQLAVSTEKQLFLYDLKGNMQSIALAFKAKRLYQWTSDNKLLMQISQDQRQYLVLYDISQNQYQVLHQGRTRWAQSHNHSEFAGVFDIEDSMSDGKEELQLELKPEARLLGLDLNTVASQVRQAVFGFEVQRVQRGREEVRVMVRYPIEARRSIETLEQMMVRIGPTRKFLYGKWRMFIRA